MGSRAPESRTLFPQNLLSVAVVPTWSSELVVRGEGLPQMVTRGQPNRLALQLLLHLRPHQKTALEAEVEQVGVGEGQRPFSHQPLQPRPPPLEHGGSLFGLGMSRTPEYLRSQNLKPTEVQGAVLEGTRVEAISNQTPSRGRSPAGA